MRDVKAAKLIDRARGCILGGVIGDAMGGPFEGQPGPLQFQEHTNWSISDDSQFTLATCESIIESCEVSPEHIAQRFAAWHQKRRFSGMGASTLKALRDLEAGAHWALSGAKGERSAGNGAAMRIAPLAFHLDPDLAEHRRTIRDVCRITHHHEESYVGALAVSAAIRWFAFAERASPSQLLANVLKYLPDSRVRDRVQALSELRDDLSCAAVGSQFGSTGYVVDSVPLALYAAQSLERLPFAVIIRNVIEAGGDTDTIASMAGQIAGAWLGASRIPPELVESIPNLHAIKRTTDEFAETVPSVMRGDERPEYLFSYGTLQSEEVQLETFGRKLEGQTDVLPGYALVRIVIDDRDFIARSGTAEHNLQFTGNTQDSVAGTVLMVSQKELEQADAYEPHGYERVLVQLKSGIDAWVYLSKGGH